MTRANNKGTLLLALASGLGLGLLVGVGIWIGAVGAGRSDHQPEQPQAQNPIGLPLEAETSSVGKNISIAMLCGRRRGRRAA